MASYECGRVLMLSYPSGLMGPFARLPIHSSIHPSIYPLSSWIQRASDKTQSRNCAQFFFLSFFLSFNPSIHPSNLEAYVYRPAYYLTAEPPFLSFPYRKPPSASSRPAHDARTNHPNLQLFPPLPLEKKRTDAAIPPFAAIGLHACRDR